MFELNEKRTAFQHHGQRSKAETPYKAAFKSHPMNDENLRQKTSTVLLNLKNGTEKEYKSINVDCQVLT